ncbi:MAG: GtrA family protein [Oscillospiraceae bacterium]|nr:GtrA family protein [Oscillospiraceae bacterium]
MLEALLQFALKLMPKPIKNLFYKYENGLRYCYYGAWTTLLSIITKLVGEWLFSLGGYTMEMDIPNMVKTAVSWVICATFAFVVNKKYVFMSKTDTTADLLREMRGFYGARLVSFFMELFIMWLTVTRFKWNFALMTVLVQVIILVSNYLFSKLVVFRKKGDIPKEADPS